MTLSSGSALTGATGGLDFHPEFELNDASGMPANGVYLVALTAQVGALDPSDPIYLVWLADASITSDLIAEETEEAIEAGLALQYFEQAVGYVESNLAVPEPGCFALAMLAIVGFVWRSHCRS